jgi:hypothetical protein
MPTAEEIEAAAEAIIAFLPGAPWDTLLRPYGLARVALEAVEKVRGPVPVAICAECRIERTDYEGPDGQWLRDCPNCGSLADPVARW